MTRLTINDDSTHFSAKQHCMCYKLHITQVMSFSEINWKMATKKNEWMERTTKTSLRCVSCVHVITQLAPQPHKFRCQISMKWGFVQRTLHVLHLQFMSVMDERAVYHKGTGYCVSASHIILLNFWKRIQDKFPYSCKMNA